MNITIHESVLDDPQSWNHLDKISFHFIEGRHLWDIDDPDDIKNSRWIQSDLGSRSTNRHLETMIRCYTASIYPSGSRLHSIPVEITLQNNGPWKLTPAEACKCLESPAHVLVENADGDGHFLQFMVVAFKRRELLDAHTEGWWKIEHLGGVNEVDKRVRHYLELADGPPRIFVLADSDRSHPGHVSQTVKVVEGCCRSLHIPFAILSKRKIENYLPLHILHRINRVRYAAFVSLNPQQQDHYEMKTGFTLGSNGQAVVHADQQSLYEHVPPRILRDLCGGFGRDASQNFRSEMGKIAEEEIRMICVTDPQEFDRILDEIEAII